MFSWLNIFFYETFLGQIDRISFFVQNCLNAAALFKWSNFGQIEIAKRQSREMSGTQADVNAFARLDISGAKKNLIDLF